LKKDEKYFCTHDKHIIKADFKVGCFTKDLVTKLKEFDVIAIDEGQFFPRITHIAEELANHGKVVIIAALSSNFKRKTMGDIGNLISKCEDITKLSAICMHCYKNSASFSFRISDETKEEVIGSKNKYISVCRSCYWIRTATKLL